MATVTLLTHTPQPEQIVAAAAKLCYSNASVEGLLDGLDPQKSAAFVDKLIGMGHESPLEHAVFTFAIQGVSRALLAQITRHRIASFSVQSQRYVAEHDFGYVLPPAIAEDREAAGRFQEAMAQAGESYTRITGLLQARYQKELEEAGVGAKQAKSQAQKRAIEDARFVLPNACDTKMILTMNTRSLHNFFRLRCCNRAQWEIREVAARMLALAHAASPPLFAGAGPGCVSGRCTEGAMSCGCMEEVRARIAALKGGEER